MTISVCIPTWNAESWLPNLLSSLQAQQLPDGLELEILVADSSSTDRSQAICAEYGIDPIVIAPGEFDHGGTRTIMAKAARGEFVVFLTHDALPANNQAITNLLKPFKDDDVVAVCGRQLPHQNAGPLGSHLRLYNYPQESSVRSWEDREQYGIKTIFLSDSFAAYRRSALEEIGWFPSGLLFGEDSLACAKFIFSGKKVAYQSDAQVYHSHDYTLAEDFRRYFDVGVFHTREAWAFDPLPKAEGEGVKFALSEWKYLVHNKQWLYLAQSPFRILAKLIGYKLGKVHQNLPHGIILNLSMAPHWWLNQWKVGNIPKS